MGTDDPNDVARLIEKIERSWAEMEKRYATFAAGHTSRDLEPIYLKLDEHTGATIARTLASATSADGFARAQDVITKVGDLARKGRAAKVYIAFAATTIPPWHGSSVASTRRRSTSTAVPAAAALARSAPCNSYRPCRRPLAWWAAAAAGLWKETWADEHR